MILVNCNDGVNTAIRNAKRRMADFNSSKEKPSEFDPGTMVHKLVEKLTGKVVLVNCLVINYNRIWIIESKPERKIIAEENHCYNR